jgi:hypothetical protein
MTVVARLWHESEELASSPNHIPLTRDFLEAAGGIEPPYGALQAPA